MKKWSFLMLSALLLMPMGASAEELPDFLNAVTQGLSEGLAEGAAAVSAASQDLTLTLATEDTRIEEGRTLLVTLTAGNPYPAATDVTLTLSLPERLSCAQPLTWNVQLEAAQLDPQTGAPVPSAATFTREVTLLPGGGSEQVQLSAELAMGTRFYRASAPLDLCVPAISASAAIEGSDDPLIEAGEAFAYQIEVVNNGSAPKDVPLSLLLPAGVTPEGELPAGFALRERTITGAVRAEAMSAVSLHLPMRVDDDALEGDEDACRLLSGVLSVDGKRTALPMLKAVGAKINAKLVPQRTTLEQGDTMELVLTVANMGLAPANVVVSCQLPEGLSVLKTPNEPEEEEEPAAALPPSEGDMPPPDGAAEAVMSEQPADARPAPAIDEADGFVRLALRMDGAKETEGGVAAATQEIALRVRADVPVNNVKDRLLGASLAWTTDGGDAQLGEAVALEVSRGGLFGLSDAEWNGVLLAALLMMVTVCCLYSAVKSDSRVDEYCFE